MKREWWTIYKQHGFAALTMVQLVVLGVGYQQRDAQVGGRR